MNNLAETTYDDLEIYLKDKQLHYYNFYNSDINFAVQQLTRYYDSHPHDNIAVNQKVQKLFLDIEVFSDGNGFDEDAIDGGIYPINIVTIRSSNDLILHTFVLLFERNFEAFGLKKEFNSEEFDQFKFDTEQEFVKQLKERKYTENEFIESNYSIKLKIYNDEKTLLLDLWNLIHEYDPDILTSWNGDKFDFWYMYNRCCTLFGEEAVQKLFSKFNRIEIRNKMVQFFEYTVCDLLYLYKPRTEGGLIASLH